MSVHDHKEREFSPSSLQLFPLLLSFSLPRLQQVQSGYPSLSFPMASNRRLVVHSFPPYPPSSSLPIPFPSSFFLQKGLTSYKLPSFLLHVLQFLKELVSSGKGMNEGSGYGRSPPGVNRLTTVRMMNGRKERERGGEVYSVRVDQKMDRWKTMKE